MTTKSEKVTADATIAKALTAKKGQTAAAIAEKTGIAVNTVRISLKRMLTAGTISVSGTTQTGTRGRPGNLYVKAAA